MKIGPLQVRSPGSSCLGGCGRDRLRDAYDLFMAPRTLLADFTRATRRGVPFVAADSGSDLIIMQHRLVEVVAGLVELGAIAPLGRPVTRDTLAAHLPRQSTPETLDRYLNELEKSGLVVFHDEPGVREGMLRLDTSKSSTCINVDDMPAWRAYLAARPRRSQGGRPTTARLSTSRRWHRLLDRAQREIESGMNLRALETVRVAAKCRAESVHSTERREILARHAKLLGTALCRCGLHQLGRDWLRKAREGFRSMTDSLGIVECSSMLSWSARTGPVDGDDVVVLPTQLRCASEALEDLAAATNPPARLRALVLSRNSATFLRAGQFDRARSLLMDAEATALAAKLADEQMYAHLRLGQLAAATGDVGEQGRRLARVDELSRLHARPAWIENLVARFRIEHLRHQALPVSVADLDLTRAAWKLAGKRGAQHALRVLIDLWLELDESLWTAVVATDKDVVRGLRRLHDVSPGYCPSRTAHRGRPREQLECIRRRFGPTMAGRR
jgi:hypothetical protein